MEALWLYAAAPGIGLVRLPISIKATGSRAIRYANFLLDFIPSNIFALGKRRMNYLSNLVFFVDSEYPYSLSPSC
jgi:hypothetical protein